MTSPPEPPASLVLVHGAGSGPWVFDGWRSRFARTHLAVPDLQGGLDVARASMADYARIVIGAASALPDPTALCGWSMGGLVVLQAAQELDLHSVVLMEASAPGELQGFDSTIVPTEGSFDPEEVYGRFPAGMRARRESSLARLERKRGIAAPTLACPSLVVFGDDFAVERGEALAELYGSTQLAFPGLDHWDLVLDERVRDGVAEFLGL